MMLETTSEELLSEDAHRRAACKSPAARLATIAAAGRAKVPFTTGILVGIGENEADRVASLRSIAELHLRYGHVQEVIIQPFTPHPGTPMADVPPPSFETVRRTVEIAREILPDDVEVQIPPNLVPDPAARLALVAAGARDFGGISPEQDFINPDERWLAPAVYAGELAAAGFELRPRLTVYPQFLNPEWLVPEVLHSAAMVAAARAVPLG
jgi:7,8-didemethyl-8-hydroxy-5-deazariboflavin synthase CofG subunit